MDKFVIRKPRELPQRKPSAPDDKELKQRTIFSLKRVVVVEDIERAKVLLDIEGQDTEIISTELEKLERKVPSQEIYEKTGIGKTLKTLRKHEDTHIAQRSDHIYKSWKRQFTEGREKPKIEVRFDRDTNKFRKAALKLIKGTLSSSSPDADKLADAIERCLFELNYNVKDSYKKQVRKTVFTLRHQQQIREKVVNKTMNVRDLCQLTSSTPMNEAATT